MLKMISNFFHKVRSFPHIIKIHYRIIPTICIQIQAKWVFRICKLPSILLRKSTQIQVIISRSQINVAAFNIKVFTTISVYQHSPHLSSIRLPLHAEPKMLSRSTRQAHSRFARSLAHFRNSLLRAFDLKKQPFRLFFLRQLPTSHRSVGMHIIYES